MALELIYPYTGTIPKSGGLTVEEEIAACIAFRDWEYTELAVKLTNNTPELNKVIDFANELFSSSLFLGEYNPATTYAQKESVSIGDDIYLSKVDGNVTTPPSASWVMMPKSVRTDNTDQDIDGVKNFLNMPTIIGDFVVESGNNANGNWVKHADGTLVQWGFKTSNANGDMGIYLPISFFNTDYRSSFSVIHDTISCNVIINKQNCTASVIIAVAFISSDNSRALVNVEWIAIGRWK